MPVFPIHDSVFRGGKDLTAAKQRKHLGDEENHDSEDREDDEHAAGADDAVGKAIDKEDAPRRSRRRPKRGSAGKGESVDGKIEGLQILACDEGSDRVITIADHRLLALP